MAAERQARRRLKTDVLKMGGLYLLVRGGLARVTTEGRKSPPALPTGSFLAHVHVAEPWAAVPDGEPLPDAVTAARDGDDGWDAPEWAEG